MATPLADVIHYLRTFGGTALERVTYADQEDIVLSFGDNITTRQANFIEAAFLTWGDFIDTPIAFGNSDVNIHVNYGDDVPAGGLGVTRTSLFFSVDHHTNIIIDERDFDDGTIIELGDLEYFTMLHELGHALGLTHPGPYNGTGELIYGVTNVYPEDYTQYTVMSYFGTGSERVPDTYNFGGLSSTPMLHDIAAIQSIYGANMSTRTGDNPYGFHSNNARTISGGNFTFDPYDFDKVNNPAFTIWDAGGIDTIDASGYGYYYDFNAGGQYVRQTIDLRAGEYSSIGFHKVGTFGAEINSKPLINNIAIAYGVTIENAIGGEGDDRITGNHVDNVLAGNRGNDNILGGFGDDTLDGGDHDDNLFGQSDDDHLIGGNGADLLHGGSGDDLLDGGAGADVLNGSDGFDTATYANATGPQSCFPRIAPATPATSSATRSSASNRGC